MPVLDTTLLEQDPRLLRRAHHVLAFLVHFYVHSTPPSEHQPLASTASSSMQQQPSHQILIPRSLSLPLLKISRMLSIAPVLTFADSVLWNFEIIDEALPLERKNIRPLTLFTGGADEANFYGCCAEIELRGVEALRSIAGFYDSLPAPQTPSSPLNEAQLDSIATCLKNVALVIDDLTTILQSVRQMCDPHAFYFAVRPWFRGSDAGGPESPLWVFEGAEEVDGMDVLGKELSGPSAGQSSIIHTLDAWLEVDHGNSFGGANGQEEAAAAAGCPMMKMKVEREKKEAEEKTINGEFMERMRKYMPGSHQEFLQELDDRNEATSSSTSSTSTTSIRTLAIQHPQHLLAPYNAAVSALKKFRDIHIRIACLYIVTMSRKAGHTEVGYVGSNSSSSAMPAACPMMKAANAAGTAERKPVRGTGGNELASLLKSCRDATTRTLLAPSTTVAA